MDIAQEPSKFKCSVLALPSEPFRIELSSYFLFCLDGSLDLILREQWKLTIGQFAKFMLRFGPTV
jgi:hypothetical protein